MDQESKERINSDYLKPYLNLDINSLTVKSCQQDFDTDLAERLQELFIPFVAFQPSSPEELLDPRLLHFSKNKFLLLKHLIHEHELHIPLSAATQFLVRLDSFYRTEILIDLFTCMHLDEWTALFLDQWSGCDGCSLYHDEILDYLHQLDLAHVKAKVYTAEQRTLEAALPEEFEVYRSAFDVDDYWLGAAWTTQAKVAQRFIQQALDTISGDGMRLRMLLSLSEEGLERLSYNLSDTVHLYKAKVKKSQVLMVRQREEGEMICLGLNTDNTEIIESHTSINKMVF